MSFSALLTRSLARVALALLRGAHLFARAALPAAVLLAAPAPAADHVKPSELFRRTKAKYLPGVVRVELWGPGGRESHGTGTFISATGELLTNQHVMRGYLEDPRGREVRFVFADGRTVRKFEIRKCNLRYSVDLCYLRVDVFPDAYFSVRGREVKPQEIVYLIGNPAGHPFQMREAHYFGTHSYDNREDVELCSGVVPGMSGGPIFTSDGRLVGLSTYQTRTREPGSSGRDKVRYFGMSARHIQRFLESK